MLCIVLWCKWFPCLMHFHWFLGNYDIDQQSTRSRPCEISTVKAVCRASIEALDLLWCRRVVDKRIPRVVYFHRGLLGNVSWRKATDVQRLQRMPISIWSIPVFKLISQAEKGIWKEHKVQTLEFPGVPGSQGPLMRFVDSSANAGVLALFEATHAEKMWPVAWQAGKWGQPVGHFELVVWKAVANCITFMLVIWFNVHFVCQSWGWKQVPMLTMLYSYCCGVFWTFPSCEEYVFSPIVDILGAELRIFVDDKLYIEQKNLQRTQRSS